jgi:GST-like protein
MIRFYFHHTPNPMKVALFLEETGMPYEVVPVDTLKGEQHTPEFRAINPNGKTPAIVDTEGLGEGPVTVFDSNAILLYLAEKSGKLLGRPADRGQLLSWLMFVASGLGPYSGQSVHFRRAAPEQIPYAQNRYLREAERHYSVLDEQLAGRTFVVGDEFTIVDIAAWGWVDRANFVLGDGRRDEFANIARWFAAIDARPAVARARAIGKDLVFKREMDEAARRNLFPQNYAA